MDERKRGDRQTEAEHIAEAKKEGFCEGFAYGERYGYEGTREVLTPSEVGGTWIMAGMLYDRIKKEGG